MPIIERHKSPDQLMELVVESANGDWTIQFEGYPWHTHADILNAWGYDGAPEARTRAFVDDILGSRRVLVVVRTDGIIRDIVVPDNLVDRPLSKSFGKYAPPNETMEVRYWNGQPGIE